MVIIGSISDFEGRAGKLGSAKAKGKLMEVTNSEASEKLASEEVEG